MTIETVRVVDVSEFTGPIPHSWWRRLRDEQGVKAAIIQAWGGGPNLGRRNDYWMQQSEGAIQTFGGDGLATYVWPPRDIPQAIDYMRGQSLGTFRLLRFIALDVEAGAGVLRWQADAIADTGIEPWVYASPGGWNAIMGNNVGFRDLSLWMAGYPRRHYEMHWDRTLESGQARYLPFGGWFRAEGWQFDGTTPYLGESLDLNVFRAEVFAPREEEVDMEALARMKRLQWVAGLFAQATAAALRDEPLDSRASQQIEYIVLLAKQERES